MSKMRNTILNQMNKSGLSTYKISKLVEGKIPQRTVYDFISGKTDTSTKVAWMLMDVLGLTVTTKHNAKRNSKLRSSKL